MSEEIRRLYDEGLTQQQIAYRLGVGKQTVWRWMKKAGIEARDHSSRGCGVKRILVAEERLRQGDSTADMAKDLGVSEETVRRRMVELGIDRLPGKARPERNVFWKGGRTIDRDGYVLLWYPFHPHATKTGYVREHRLVMEEHLGRLLQPWEVVHHRNGVRANNAIENLELFASNGDHLRHELTGRQRQSRQGGSSERGANQQA